MYKLNATKLLSAHLVALLVVMSSVLFAQNNPPVGGNEYLSIDEDAPVTYIGNLLVNDSDADADSLWITMATSSVPGAFVSNNFDGSVDYYTFLNYCGVDTILYTVTDGIDFIVDTLFLTINCINDAPTQGNESMVLNEDDPATATPILLANNFDVELDPIWIGTITGPSNGTFTNNGNGTYDYTPFPDFCGYDTVSYEVTDGMDITIDWIFIVVNCVNDLPVGGNETMVINEDDPTTTSGFLLSNNSDIDGGLLSIGTITNTGGGSFVYNGDGSIDYTPDADFCGEDTVVYEVSDGIGTITDTLFVTITCVNDLPTNGNETVFTDVDVPISNIDILANNTDIEGGILSVSNPVFPFTTSSGGTITSNPDGSINYTPPAGFEGIDTLIYTVCDDWIPPGCVDDTIFFIVSGDLDNDGVVNVIDIDSDNDGIANVMEELTALNNGNTDLDANADILDLDADGDGLYDIVEGGGFDFDGNGLVDNFIDTNANGMDDEHEMFPLSLPDADGQGTPNFQDYDDDGDGVLTIDEYDINLDGVPDDCDVDGLPNYLDPESCDLLIPEVFSPNADGTNDEFFINGIGDYPNNSLNIFNRWGNIVYKVNNYQNDWVGTNESGTIAMDGVQLPVGTYFYVLDLGDGSDKITGYIYLTR